MTSLLEADDIRKALRDLAGRLTAAGVRARIKVVGGAALAIEYFDRPATRDVDCLLSPAAEIKAVAADVAHDRGWPEDWLNDKVVIYQSHHDADSDWKTVLDQGGVTVFVASAQLLLAMKLHAGRGRRDGADIEKLLVACAVERLQEVEEIFDRYYPQAEIKPAARNRVEAWLAAQNDFL